MLETKAGQVWRMPYGSADTPGSAFSDCVIVAHRLDDDKCLIKMARPYVYVSDFGDCLTGLEQFEIRRHVLLSDWKLIRIEPDFKL